MYNSLVLNHTFIQSLQREILKYILFVRNLLFRIPVVEVLVNVSYTASTSASYTIDTCVTAPSRATLCENTSVILPSLNLWQCHRSILSGWPNMVKLSRRAERHLRHHHFMKTEIWWENLHNQPSILIILSCSK